jgi:leader peptidase (prepilin peptidase)/N-methyltransferase
VSTLWAPLADRWPELFELLPMNIAWTDIFSHDLQVNAAGRWFLIAIATVLGGIFGSFMNVVAYRLPLGMSLSRPGSHCPACRRPIRWYDNVPVLGWIRLGGRCRDCGARISARYPLVEAAVAGMAALLAWRATGSWIPDASVEGGGIYQVNVVQFAFHFVLMCTLASVALIEFDGHAIPAQLIWLPCGVGLLVLWFWPSLQPMGEWIDGDGAWAGLSGMLAAVTIGAGPWLCAWISDRRSGIVHANAALGELVLVGAFLGDRSVVVIGVVSMTILFFMRLSARALPPAGRYGWAGCLASITLIWLLVYPSVLPEFPAMWRHAGSRLFAAAVVMTLLAALVTFLTRRRTLPAQR